MLSCETLGLCVKTKTTDEGFGSGQGQVPIEEMTEIAQQNSVSNSRQQMGAWWWVRRIAYSIQDNKWELGVGQENSVS